MNLQPVLDDAGWASRIAASASQKTYGTARPMNVHRAMIVEAIVAEALGPEWEWCSGNYSAWDFIRIDGMRLEIKQSAARQSWSPDGAPPSKSSFDIRERKGRYDDIVWIEQCCRWSQIFVFAHHPRIDKDADHRVPAQWDFYVVAKGALPAQKTLALSGVQALARKCSFDELRATIDALAMTESPVDAH